MKAPGRAGRAFLIFLICLCAGIAAPVFAQVETPTDSDGTAGEESGEALPDRPLLYALDILLPGYGSLRSGRPGWAAAFFVTRVATAAAGYDAYVSMVEYRSAERAARLAVTLRGPGLLFPDPYTNSFRTADEFQRLADRRAAIMSAAGTLHLFLTGLSLLLTHTFYQDGVDARAPVFTIGLTPGEGDDWTGRMGVGVRF